MSAADTPATTTKTMSTINNATDGFMKAILFDCNKKTQAQFSCNVDDGAFFLSGDAGLKIGRGKMTSKYRVEESPDLTAMQMRTLRARLTQLPQMVVDAFPDILVSKDRGTCLKCIAKRSACTHARTLESQVFVWRFAVKQPVLRTIMTLVYDYGMLCEGATKQSKEKNAMQRGWGVLVSFGASLTPCAVLWGPNAAVDTPDNPRAVLRSEAEFELSSHQAQLIQHLLPELLLSAGVLPRPVVEEKAQPMAPSCATRIAALEEARQLARKMLTAVEKARMEMRATLVDKNKRKREYS